MQDALHDWLEEWELGFNERPVGRFHVWAGPEVRCVVGRVVIEVKRPPTENPAFDQVRVDVAGLLDGEIPLAYRPVAFGAKAHLVFERHRGEDLFDCVLCVLDQRRIDTVSFENHEADVLHR